MGGCGSGNASYWRDRETKTKVEDCVKLDIRRVKARVEDGEVADIEQQIRFKTRYDVPQRGMIQFYLVCPKCGETAQILYRVPNGTDFFCRRCQNLAYKSQTRSAKMRRAIKNSSPFWGGRRH